MNRNITRRLAVVELVGIWCSTLCCRIELGDSSFSAEQSVTRGVALLADEVDRGTPVLVAFQRVADQCGDARVSLAFREMKETVREGGAFLEVMERFPDLFPARFRAVFDTDACQEMGAALREASQTRFRSG